MTADDIIRLLGLEPHPEGGHFRETFRDRQTINGRSCSTAIYYLLKKGEVSRWHRIDAVEIWHWYAGAPLELKIHDGSDLRSFVLGSAVTEGQTPQAVVPVRSWQSARSLGAYSLVGCTVALGFEFAGFELAPLGWEPG
jgi:predicted cupin superfamily sugar epimerase